MTTVVVEAGGIIGDAVIMMDGVTTADSSAAKSGALSAAFFVPAINLMG
ncbi:hypothetical protein HU811_17965 [Pseudomonas sp. SWRI196]|uniref:Uncharacterized protein n=1 Tax=Pseudomonas tehranensis TaxID=2745502 RepID=A0ABR6UVB7_9PSED|nr:hypothetical protein [Pseudomonas tehranensis]